MSSTSNCLRRSLAAPTDSLVVPFPLLAMELGLSGEVALDRIVWVAGISRGTVAGLGEGRGEEGAEPESWGVWSRIGGMEPFAGYGEPGVRESFGEAARAAPAGSDTLMEGVPLGSGGASTEWGGVEVLSSVGSGWVGSWMSLSLPVFLAFLEGCWPMGPGGCGDWGRALDRREVKTERRVGASLRECYVRGTLVKVASVL